MGKAVLLLACLALLHTAAALKCKKCTDFECKTLVDDTCPAAGSGKEAACLLFVYKQATDGKEVTDRKCVLRDKSGKFECVKISTKDTELTCKTCTEDGCNASAASAMEMSALAAVGVVVAILATKLF